MIGRIYEANRPSEPRVVRDHRRGRGGWIPAGRKLPERLPCKRHAGRNICGWLGIVAGPVVFVAAQPVPLDDPALVVALGLAVRGGRMIPATCLLADTDTLG